MTDQPTNKQTDRPGLREVTLSFQQYYCLYYKTKLTQLHLRFLETFGCKASACEEVNHTTSHLTSHLTNNLQGALKGFHRGKRGKVMTKNLGFKSS